MSTLSILGSTGSIGTQALELVRLHPDRFQVKALTAHRNAELLFRQVREFRPELAGLTVPIPREEIPADLGFCRFVMGPEALHAAAAEVEVDQVLVSVVGIAGLQSVMDALSAGRQVLLANKEALVTGGHLVMEAARRAGKPLLPVDSEHSAIFQCLQGAGDNRPTGILLTASGGPVRGKKRDELRGKTTEDALKHPNWSMGRKITIDSATMVNKGLEVLEASWLFDVPVDKIQVVVQPQSIVHSAVQYVDGAVKAQLGLPDMRIPIEYALYAPNRRALKEDERLDLAALMQLTFENPDMETFKGLALGYRAGRTGGSMPTVYNAANEEAVAMFLQDRIDFLEIADVIEEAMDAHEGHVLAAPTLAEILEIEAWARDFVRTHSQIVRV